MTTPLCTTCRCQLTQPAALCWSCKQRILESLCAYEMSLLRKLASGESVAWGAAVGQAIEVLHAQRLVDIDGAITDRGQEVAAC